MKVLTFSLAGVLSTVLVASAVSRSTPEGGEKFTLAAAVPNDVFLYIAERKNPERKFLDDYWGEVFKSLKQTGIGDDLIDLLRSLTGMDPEGSDEIKRLRERASQLLAGVDWNQLDARESAFAERFDPPLQVSGGGPPVMMADMVWLLRGHAAGTAKNFEGLVAILDAMVEECNRAMGADALRVEKTESKGAKVASVNILGMVPGAPKLPLSVGRRDDLIIIGMRGHLFADVLALLDGGSSKPPLERDARFKAAFAQLPPAENSMVFFDMNALVKPLRAFLGAVVGLAGGPNDVYLNARMNAEVNQLNSRALSAYLRGDAKEALALIRQAYAADGDNSIVLYNLACFSALVGEKNEALGWLEKAVEGGFYAPAKIASDPDLESLREEARYKDALAKAADRAGEYAAKDIVINSSKTGEAASLLQQAMQVYEQKDFERGLKFAEQAYAVAPKDSRVLYSLACFHSVLGHNDKALDFLEQAVDGGFCCPRHIAKDPDLEGIRTHERYKAVVAKARRKAAESSEEKRTEEVTAAKQVLERLLNAVDILDYAATVEITDGYSVSSHSVTALVPDARHRAIYPVFGNRKPLTEFERYLPQETDSFSISSGFDPREAYKFILDSVRLIGPKGQELLDKWAAIQASMGIDVQKDFFDWIDGAVIRVTLADDGGFIWLFKVREPQVAREKVSAAVNFLTTKLPQNLGQMASKHPALAGLAMLSLRTSPVEHERLEGFQTIHLATMPQPVAVWGVADGYLVVGKSADAVALCFATAKGEHPNVRQNARIMKEAIVPDGPFASVTLVDRRGTGDELATMLGAAAIGLGMAGASVPNAEVRPVLAKIAGMIGKAAPVVRKIDFYKSVASLTTFDGQMWRSRSVTHYFSPAERPARSGG